MQTKDFKGQDLRGKSFKNQDLTGADFSDCDLRGVDFSFANLTDAKFCNARMGRTLKVGFWVFILQTLLGLFAASYIALGNAMPIFLVKGILERLNISINENLIIAIVSYTLFFSTVIIK
jgi:hypothetical protein